MLTILAQQASATPEPSQQLDSFLKYGQMGLALAILVVGAGLFTAAVKQQNLNETTAGILKFFAKVMIIVFVVSFLGEMVTKVLDFVVKQKSNLFDTAIEVPALIEGENYQKYGPVEITVNDWSPKPSERRHANTMQKFAIHDRTQFTIDVGRLIERIKRNQDIATSATDKTAAKGAIGTGGPQ
jgi:hypothetical protein